MKKLIKKNYKFILGMIIGLIWSSGIAYAATILFDSDEVSYDNTTSGLSATNVQSALDELYVESTSYQLFETRVSTLESQIYPVGSIYISTTKTTASAVASLFGGTWVSFGTGRTLVGVDTSDTSFDTVEETGGEKTHTLTYSEIPQHNHYLRMNGLGTTKRVTYNTANCPANGASCAGISLAGSGYDVLIVDGGNPGGGAHNNLQPYITVYMYKRTA